MFMLFMCVTNTNTRKVLVIPTSPKKMEDNFSCAICMELAENAVETSCCHYIFCESCLSRVDKNRCPLCRCQFDYSPSYVVRRIVGGMEIECSYRCGTKLPRSEKDAHEQTCPNRMYSCPSQNCQFQDNKDGFLQHLSTFHARELLLNSSRLFEMDECVVRARQSDRIATKRNEHGREARLGSSGKYYCRGRLEVNCRCCNGHCGPTNGCNCAACMKLDVTARLLPKNWLVNRDGYPSRKGETDNFYCGRRVMTRDARTDGHCGPTNGNNCPACEKLDVQNVSRYSDVWS